jgi:hypothetical protein
MHACGNDTVYFQVCIPALNFYLHYYIIISNTYMHISVMYINTYIPTQYVRIQTRLRKKLHHPLPFTSYLCPNKTDTAILSEGDGDKKKL